MCLNPKLALVRGKIVLSKDLSSFSQATANIYLEDVSYIDAASKIVARQVISDICHKKGTENQIEFVLTGETKDDCTCYSLRVHITNHQDQEIHRGDFITTQSYPVLTQGHSNQIWIHVQEVK